MQDRDLTHITKKFVSEVRNQTLVDVYLKLEGRVNQDELADIYGISRVRIAQLIADRKKRNSKSS